MINIFQHVYSGVSQTISDGVSVKNDKKLAVLICAACCVVLLAQFLAGGAIGRWLFPVMVYSGIGFFWTFAIRPISYFWFGIAGVGHVILNPLVLGFTFFLILVPMGIVQRLSQLALRKKSESFWVERTENPSFDDFKRLF